jgi:4-amino-4-deoxy-L-arabinose transferase-like glycosyltransferase
MVQARTLEAIEAIEAIDALETSTLGGLEARTAKALNTVEAISALEARTAQAIKTIEAMTADALEAIDATAAEVTPELTSKLVSPDQADQAEGDEAETPAPDGADSGGPDRGEATSSARAGDAESSPGTDVARTRVIHIDEPPASVTLVTSATETIIALPHPRAESLVSVAPAPPVTTTAPLPLVPSREPAALPAAEPQPKAEPKAKPRRVRWSRRTRVSRGLLLGILCLQAILSLRLHRSAFEDEALYLYSGHMELEHLLHGSALQGTYASYFSGAPVLYPVAAAAVNQVGGLAAVRALSLIEMLATTTLLYALTRRLFNERVALCAAALFSVTASVIFLGDFATYDATCLFLLATAAWIMVRTAVFRWPVFLLAAPVAALAVGVKYAGLLFVPTIAVLPALAGWPARSWRVLLYPPAFVAAVGGLLYAGLRVGGHAYQAAISQTTTNRAQGAVPVTTFLREFAEWGGVIFVLAVIGTVAYIWRARTEPDEHIATVGGRFWRAAIGVVLTGTALLAPLYQAHLHTDISFQKHIGFGLFFAAPIAGLGLSRILGDHLRHPHVGVAAWSLALVLGLTWSGEYFQVWPDSGQFVQAFSTYLKPNGRYLVEAPEVPIYYLENNPDAQPRQFYSTYYLSYTNKKGVTKTGPAGYVSALKDGYFQTVVYYFQVTPPVDGVLAHTLATSRSYYLAAEIGMSDSFGAGDYFVWVKGHAPAPGGVFAHASSKYPDLGTKLRELAP